MHFLLRGKVFQRSCFCWVLSCGVNSYILLEKEREGGGRQKNKISLSCVQKQTLQRSPLFSPAILTSLLPRRSSQLQSSGLAPTPPTVCPGPAPLIRRAARTAQTRFLTAESGSLKVLAVPGLLGCSSGLRGTFGLNLLKLPGPNQPLRPLGQLLCDLPGHLTNPLKTLNSRAKLYMCPQASTGPAIHSPVCAHPSSASNTLHPTTSQRNFTARHSPVSSGKDPVSRTVCELVF